MEYIICSFFGDGNCFCTEEVKSTVKKTVEKLITENGVNVFLFASRSEFELLCLKTVTELKNMYPHVRCLYVRAERGYVNEEYKEFVANNYDDTFCPFESSAKRNRYIIDNSEYCVFGGKTANNTKTAYKYATKRKRHVVDLQKE